MGLTYRAVTWNRQKRIYDSVLLLGVSLYLVLFIGLGAALFPRITLETLIIRALGTAALLLLHLVLMIGPLARLDTRFLPLLYNRRHLGVTLFVLALGHGLFALVQFHFLGDLHPLVSLLLSGGPLPGASAAAWAAVPFQPLGALALLIFFLMAATSHDFWLANLTAPVWKALHMLVYLAYASVLLHVALGILQAETAPLFAGLLGLGMALVLGLHLVAGGLEARADRELTGYAEPEVGLDHAGFVPICRVDEIPEKRARVVTLSGERVAIFRYDGQISALSNVCQHQNGPLGEGRIVDGCVTCPWHGYQYLPATGASPPPFEEAVPTFRVRLEGDQVWVHPVPNPPGTEVEPARIKGTSCDRAP